MMMMMMMMMNSDNDFAVGQTFDFGAVTLSHEVV
jgi:hypothetical protein